MSSYSNVCAVVSERKLLALLLLTQLWFLCQSTPDFVPNKKYCGIQFCTGCGPGGEPYTLQSDCWGNQI